jgi:hypothetical protein
MTPLPCDRDAVNGGPRSLLNRVDVPSGVSAETCTAACKAAGFTLAGLEYAQECCESMLPLPCTEVFLLRW